MHIGYWMILVCGALFGCVCAIMFVEWLRNVKKIGVLRSKDDVMKDIDRIAEREGLYVETIVLKPQEKK